MEADKGRKQMLGTDKFPQVELPFADVSGRLIQGDRHQVVLVELNEGVDVQAFFIPAGTRPVALTVVPGMCARA